jgi:hypothetical protein
MSASVTAQTNPELARRITHECRDDCTVDNCDAQQAAWRLERLADLPALTHDELNLLGYAVDQLLQEHADCQTERCRWKRTAAIVELETKLTQMAGMT